MSDEGHGKKKNERASFVLFFTHDLSSVSFLREVKVNVFCKIPVTAKSWPASVEICDMAMMMPLKAEALESELFKKGVQMRT